MKKTLTVVACALFTMSSVLTFAQTDAKQAPAKKEEMKKEAPAKKAEAKKEAPAKKAEEKK